MKEIAIAVMEPLPVETLSLVDLQSNNPTVRAYTQNAIERAFGANGHGILVVYDLPSWFTEQRELLLDAGNQLPSLPEPELSALEFKSVNYSIGWSHGKEVFDGRCDFSKGSFYANPIFDAPSFGDHTLVEKYPINMYPNKWPSSLSVRHLESSFKQLGKLLNDTALTLATHCDELVHSRTGVNPSLREMIEQSRVAKGRLLHYFPWKGTKAEENIMIENDQLWCGFHNDHGAITALLPAKMYGATAPQQQTPQSTQSGSQPQPCSDPHAGLYIAADGENPRRVVIPKDAIAFQIGETAQIVTAGFFRATAHAVRAPRNTDVARITMAVFTQPNPWVQLNMPENAPSDALDSSPLVPSLKCRFKRGATFDEFARATYDAFYS